jgi:hypothetical protein
MNLAYKVTGLPIATQASDAVRFDQLPNVTGFLTQQQADGLYMGINQTLTGIQQNNSQVLDMAGQKISNTADPTSNQDVVTLAYFNTHSGPTGPADEIVNASGFTSVKCNSDQTISLVSNSNEIVKVEP